FAGVLIIGLGCEGNQMDALFFTQGLAQGPLLRAMSIQDKGGTAKAVAEGIAAIKEMLPAANAVSRTTVPASHIVVGLQCGGSDGYSGITATTSLGAVAKGGTTGLMGVYEYAQPVTAKGFVFMDTPGYDPVSATGQVAGGANMICFTTGRGSVYGCKPSPSLKLATNTTMYERM